MQTCAVIKINICVNVTVLKFLRNFNLINYYQKMESKGLLSKQYHLKIHLKKKFHDIKLSWFQPNHYSHIKLDRYNHIHNHYAKKKVQTTIKEVKLSLHKSITKLRSKTSKNYKLKQKL